MIPKIIHYVWLGNGKKPELVQNCLASWHRIMPETDGWTYMDWTEQTIEDLCNKKNLKSPISNLQYCAEAYAAHKYAFVSDYVRLWALEQYGGVYLDTDVEVIRSFNELPEFTTGALPFREGIGVGCNSFIGFEESKAKTLGTNVIGCEPHCAWVKEMLSYYERTSFIKADSSLDMTANSELIAQLMEKHGLVRNGNEQYVKIRDERLEDGAERLQVRGEVIHVYDYHHFSPITSTRVMRKTKDTFSIHHCYGSWTEGSKGNRIRNSVIVRELINVLIQIKRFIKNENS